MTECTCCGPKMGKFVTRAKKWSLVDFDTLFCQGDRYCGSALSMQDSSLKLLTLKLIEENRSSIMQDIGVGDAF